jgi:hypothetical protein
MTGDPDNKTAWRKLLDAHWIERSGQIDWMHAPYMHDHVRLTMGTAPWIECARDAHLVPLADKLKARGDGELYGV